MSNQGAYKLYPDAGTVGQLASVGMPNRIRSLVNGATVLPFGRIVSFDTSGNLALGGTTRYAGCTLDCTYIPGATGDNYPAEALVAVADIGDVFVNLATGSADAVIGGAVYVVRATGEVRANADTATATLLKGAKFTRAGAAGTLVSIALTAPSV